MAPVTQEPVISPGPSVQVGDWRVDPARNEIRRGDHAVRLEPKVIEVLGYLAKKPGEVVGREELLSAIWPGVVVGDDTLTQAVIKLRKALGDDARQPTYIETISKRGYRLIARVEPGSSGALAAPPRRPFLGPSRGVLAAIVATAAIGGLAVFPEFLRKPWPMVAEGPRVAAAAVPVIAVLPFGNLSGDATRDYFSDGLTEDIISALGRFSGLGVIAHSSVGHLKHRPPGTRAVEAELGARYIVDGSVRDADGRLRVSVELSDAHEGRLLWSDRFEGAGSDLFDIQDRIVRNIVGALSVKITRLEQARASARPAASLEAYDLVLRARALLSRTERSANRQARELLARAQGLAPDYAGVHVVMAQAQTQRVSFGWVESPHDALSRAEDGARQALSLEDESAHSGAYALLADVANFRGDFEAALEYADRAIVLNPSDAETRHRRGMVMLYMGRVEEALASLEAAHRLNPRMNGGQGVTLALAYFLLGRYREGLAVVDEALTRFPDIAFLHAVRAAILAEVGNLDEARLAAARVRKLSPNFDAERFGTRFRDPAHTARIQEALRKARY